MITRVSLAMQSAGMAHFLRCPTCASCLPPSLQAGAPPGLPWGQGKLYVYSFIKQRAGMSPPSICWMVGRSTLPGGSSRSLPPSRRIHLAPAKLGLSLPCSCLTGVTWAVNQAETHYNFLCLVASYLSPYLSFGRGGCEAICLFLLEPVAEKCLSRFTQLSGYPQPGPPAPVQLRGSASFSPPHIRGACLVTLWSKRGLPPLKPLGKIPVTDFSLIWLVYPSLDQPEGPCPLA